VSHSLHRTGHWSARAGRRLAAARRAGRRARSSTAIALCASLFLLFAEAAPAHASARSDTNAGNDLFRQGKYPEARARYLAAQADVPDAPEIDLNLGAALYQEGRYEDALRSFFALPKKEKATPTLAGAAAYDAGNALFKLGRYDEAIEAFKQALRTNPADVDAKHNLELAQKKKQEQEKQEEQQQQENEPGNEGEKKENEEQSSDQQGQGGEQDSSKSDSSDQQQGDKSDQEKKKEESGEKKQEQQGGNESEQQQQEQQEQQQQGQQGEQDQKQQGRPEQGEGQGAAGQQGPVPEGGISREDAMRFLEALEASEMQRAREEDEKALLQRLLDEGRDW